jgi:hypothetical protein
MAQLGRIPLLATASLVILVAACYGGVLFGRQQFAFRDSAHFYYPLYWRVQQEWSAGRLPLWEPGANGGKPMLGEPMAAILYPGKLVFALVPYAWGIRLYTVGHEVLAFWAMFALMRHWGVTATGATLSGLAYAFGGPVFSDYFNIIYLVGAAWLPLGFRAADRWLRLARRAALVELALVLAMQVLGGDPEAAYLTILCAFGYALGLARSESGAPARTAAWILGVAVAGIGWVWPGPMLARALHGGGRSGQLIVAAVWAVGIVAYLARRHAHRARFAGRLIGLAASGVVALMLSAMQVLPALEQIAASVRWAGSGPDYLYDFSLLPYRIVEWAWPNVFGTFTSGHCYWMAILPPIGAQRPSPLTLYSGALSLVLALGAAGFRGGPPWRTWMTAVALLSLWASLGEFAGPARWSVAEPSPTTGDDSFYGMLATALPGLRLFRFPFKCLVLTALGFSALAGSGWDRIGSGIGRRKTIGVAIGLSAVTLVALVAVVGLRGRIASTIAQRGASHDVFGPLDASRAADDVIWALGHGSVALVLALAALAWHARRPSSTGPAALAVALLAIDLAAAQAPLVITIPQEDFDREPEVVRAIRQAERAEPSAGPFRVHRLASWVPIGWAQTPSRHRLRELVDWEIDTLQPYFGWLHATNYVFADESETGRNDYRRLFVPTYRLADPVLAASLGVEPGRPILYHPRSLLNAWGARYFILPSYPGDWTLENRSYAALLDRTDLIYPPPASLEGPEHNQDRREWLSTRDFQVRRNRAAFPRAWIVHHCRPIRPIDEAPPGAQTALIKWLRSGDSDTHSDVPDLRRTAYIETADATALAPYLTGDPRPELSMESVDVRYESATRVVIRANARRPGVLILADTFDRGWRLTIDDRPAPVLRANLVMRAAAIPGGCHTLVYTFEPAALDVGRWTSAAGILALAGLIVWARRSASRRISESVSR